MPSFLSCTGNHQALVCVFSTDHQNQHGNSECGKVCLLRGNNHFVCAHACLHASLKSLITGCMSSEGVLPVQSNALQIRQVLETGCQKEQCTKLLADLSRLETQPVTDHTISDYQAFLKEASELLQCVSKQVFGALQGFELHRFNAQNEPVLVGTIPFKLCLR